MNDQRPHPIQTRRSRIPGRGVAPCAAVLLLAATFASSASAATAANTKGAAGKSTCVDEIWEIRAVPADKVGTDVQGNQVVVIEPSNERAEETSGTLCPKPLHRTVIQIVPKLS
ncbi:MAG: hypothetical protein U0610_29590 [bacterium]